MLFISAVSRRYAIRVMQYRWRTRAGIDSSHLNRIKPFRRIAQRVACVYDQSARRNGRLNRPRASVLAADNRSLA
jgi:hypothetical protein